MLEVVRFLATLAERCRAACRTRRSLLGATPPRLKRQLPAVASLDLDHVRVALAIQRAKLIVVSATTGTIGIPIANPDSILSTLLLLIFFCSTSVFTKKSALVCCNALFTLYDRCCRQHSADVWHE